MRVTPRLTMVVTTLVTAKRDSQNDNLKSPLNKGNNDGDASEETNINNEIKLDNTSEEAKRYIRELDRKNHPIIRQHPKRYQRTTSQDRASFLVLDLISVEPELQTAPFLWA